MSTQVFNQQKETRKSPRSLSAEKELTVVKRTGAIVPFNRERITRALAAAFRDTKKIPLNEPLPQELGNIVDEMTKLVVAQLISMASKGVSLTVEGIQDTVELTLMQNRHLDVAKGYIIYRDHHKGLREDAPQNLKVMRKDGHWVRFNPMKIASALERALTHSASSAREQINELTDAVVKQAVEHAKLVSDCKNPRSDLPTDFTARQGAECEGNLNESWRARAHCLAAKDAAKMNTDFCNQTPGGLIEISVIDEIIEKLLMKEGHFEAAKAYILERAKGKGAHIPTKKEEGGKRSFTVTLKDGATRLVSESHLLQKFTYACQGLKATKPEELLELALTNFYEGIQEHEVDFATLFAARSKIEIDLEYAKVASRLLLDILYRETMGITAADPNLHQVHAAYFKKYIKRAIHIERLSPKLFEFDLDRLAAHMELSRDDLFHYLGLRTLYDRYFIHEEERRLETPQIFWMRVAMGLALAEKENRNERAIEFYNTLSTFHFISGTPTLFNSGTLHAQLSSCYLSTVDDDLEHIFKVISDDALLSKWAGGLGNDWTSVRATGSRIKGTNGKSQGVIPFLKVANDTALAVNQGGKRKGAICAYLETWHLDVEEFLELRKNTGDERRRTHDMHTANWIPDLFMKRVQEEKNWTLFSPSDTPDLHDLYGEAFEKRYVEYEALADEGKIKLFKRLEARTLWRKMLSMLFETGHPWITFKDPSNIRSPQDHVGVVHNSNLCTEILLNTSREETAVCNIGSINLAAHTTVDGIDAKKLEQTITTAIRMLDNVIDVNFYPTEEAKRANEKHRAIGLGLMGFQDALHIQHVSYASHEAVEFADRSTEMLSYYAILASSTLAKERGSYQTFKGSKWDRGLLPIDTIELLAKERKERLEMNTSSSLDWGPVRESIQKHGMRNCNTMAIAPTATIANIAGITQSIEPSYKHLFVKSNLSGDFTVCNPYLVAHLKGQGLWDKEMLDDLKYFDGSISEIARLPEETKHLFLTAFEIDPEWIIECASRRQKWIDMGQSLNLYLSSPGGKKLSDMYITAWKKGLKTCYYCRTLAATQIEKSTTDINKRGLQPRWMKNKSASGNIHVQRESAPQACTLGEECQSCQ